MTNEEQKDYDEITDRMLNAERIVSEITGELYGKGFEVEGWRMNGETEPLDSLFEENNWEIKYDK